MNGFGVFEIFFFLVDGSGKFSIEVFEFIGIGGVIMGMYNIDEVIIRLVYWEDLYWSDCFLICCY